MSFIVGPHVSVVTPLLTTLLPHNLAVKAFSPLNGGMLTSSKGCMLHFIQLDLLTSWEHVWNTFFRVVGSPATIINIFIAQGS